MRNNYFEKLFFFHKGEQRNEMEAAVECGANGDVFVVNKNYSDILKI